MKNLKINLLLIGLIAFGFSCSKNDDDCNTSTPTEKTNFLENIRVGEKLHYSMFIGEDYFNGSGQEYSYTGDTLELEVLQITSSGVLLSERITPGSAMMFDTLTTYWNKDSVFVNLWKITGDSLFVESDEPYFASHLIFSSRLKLSDFSGQEVTISGWKTSYDNSEGNAQLYATNYSLFDHLYDTVSVYIHNAPMTYDGAGNTTVYNWSRGIIRASVYSPWTGTGYGWDLF